MEGLHRASEDVRATVPEECYAVFGESIGAASAARAAIQRAIENAGNVLCPPPPHRDSLLRDALVRHAKRFLVDLQPRLVAASKTRVNSPHGCSRGASPSAMVQVMLP